MTIVRILAQVFGQSSDTLVRDTCLIIAFAMLNTNHKGCCNNSQTLVAIYPHLADEKFGLVPECCKERDDWQTSSSRESCERTLDLVHNILLERSITVIDTARSTYSLSRVAVLSAVHSFKSNVFGQRRSNRTTRNRVSTYQLARLPYSFWSL